MTKNIPMSQAYQCTELVGVRVTVETKARIKSLKSKGVYTAELMRKAILEAINQAEESVSNEKAS